MGVPRQRGYCLPRGAAPAVQPARRREPVARAASPLSNRRPRPAPVVPSSVRLSPFQTRARRARPAPGATRGCPCHRRPVLPAASAVWPRRSSILLTAPRRVAVRCGGGARRRRLPDGRRAQLRCARPPPSAVSSLCFPALPPSGDRGSWRRRLSPAAARASCSSLSILLLLKPRPKNSRHWASARSAVSWCRRNGRGDRHRIGGPRRAASIFRTLSAGAAESSARRNELPSYSARPRRAHALGVRCRGGLRFRELQSARRPKSSRLMRCSRSTQL